MATELAQIEHSHDCKHCVEQWCLDFLCWGMTKGIIVLRFLVLSILVAFGFVYKFIWFFSLCYCLFGIQFSLVKSCFPVLFYSFPKRWWLLGVDQDEARRLELTPGVSYDWQWLKYFKHHLPASCFQNAHWPEAGSGSRARIPALQSGMHTLRMASLLCHMPTTRRFFYTFINYKLLKFNCSFILFF